MKLPFYEPLYICARIVNGVLLTPPSMLLTWLILGRDWEAATSGAVVNAITVGWLITLDYFRNGRRWKWVP